MNNDKILLEKFINNHCLDAVQVLEQLEENDVSAFIDELTIDASVNLFSIMEPRFATICLESLDIEKAVQILELLPSRISTSILRRILDENRSIILGKMKPEIANKIKYKLTHVKNTVAALMVTNVQTIPEDMSVKETLEIIKKNIAQPGQYIFIVNRNHKLMGIVHLFRLIAAETKHKITSLMETEFFYLSPDQHLNKILKHPGWLEFNTLPVLDRDGILLGTITRKNIQFTARDMSSKIPNNILNAGDALGELYKIGLTSLLSGIAQGQEDNE